ncbi:hypothetical protein KC963_04735, partial [Candidatus Saccharibacteria bacterium]|nr:hypothetical protein [Candidatus Saccharibacteria bacterium]
MANQNTSPSPTPPEEAWDAHAEHLYEQGEINATQARILSGIPVQRTVELTTVPTPRPVRRGRSARSR